jgi:predicted cation transporter
MNFENLLVLLIYIIIGIKILFLFSTLSNLFLTKIIKNDDLISKYSEKLKKIKEQTEFVFIFLTSILMIAIFYPRQNNMKYINEHVKLLFYLFGWILIITANWNLFFHESIFLKKITDSLK